MAEDTPNQSDDDEYLNFSNKEVGTDSREEVIERLVQVHHMPRYFSAHSSNDRLTLANDLQRVERRDYYEIFPVATIPVSSSLCSLLNLRFRHLSPSASYRLSYDCSIGALSEPRYLHDFNLIDHIGCCEATLGMRLVKRPDDLNGRVEIAPTPAHCNATAQSSLTLSEGDVLSILLTPAIDDRYDITSPIANCHFFHNFRLVGSAGSGDEEALSLEEGQLFGIVLSPNTSFEIVEGEEMCGLMQMSSPSEVVRRMVDQAIATTHPPSTTSPPPLLSPRQLQLQGTKNESESKASVNRDPEGRKEGRGGVYATADVKEDLCLSPRQERAAGAKDQGDSFHNDLSSLASLPPSRPAPPVPSFFPKQSAAVSQLEWNRPKSTKKKTSSTIDSPSQSQALEETLLCCICLAAQKTVLLMPCKHLCLCESCAEEKSDPSHREGRAQVSWKIEACPVCRSKIHHRMKIFL